MNKACVLGTVLLVMGLSACTKSEDEKMDLSMEEAGSKPVSIEEGSYVVAVECMDKEKNESLPQINKTYRFKKDGTYSASIVNYDPSCAEDCDRTIEGTYRAFESTFIITPRKIIADVVTAIDSSEVPPLRLFVLAYPSKIPSESEKSQIVLQDFGTQNECHGKMIWVMEKK